MYRICLWHVCGCYLISNYNVLTLLSIHNYYEQITFASWGIEALTGNRELGFCSGEGVWEIATTSKEGSRRVNYPIAVSRGSDKKSQYYALWL